MLALGPQLGDRSRHRGKFQEHGRDSVLRGWPARKDPTTSRLLNGGHFDVWAYSLYEIVRCPPLQLGAGVAGGPSVQTTAQHTVWRAWEVDTPCSS